MLFFFSSVAFNFSFLSRKLWECVGWAHTISLIPRAGRSAMLPQDFISKHILTQGKHTPFPFVLWISLQSFTLLPADNQSISILFQRGLLNRIALFPSLPPRFKFYQLSYWLLQYLPISSLFHKFPDPTPFFSEFRK